MGEKPLTLKQALSLYDRWLEDSRVEFYPEPNDLEADLQAAMVPFADQPASKWIGDAFLLAHAKRTGAHLVTFDRELNTLALKHQYAAILPN